MIRMLQIIPLLMLLACTGWTRADEIRLRPEHPERHVVVKGDTLWDISARFLQSPWQWPRLWQHNRDHIKNPHWIYPGDVVELYWMDGEPRLRLQRDAVIVDPTIIVSRLDNPPIPVIQPSSIQPFLNRPLLVDGETFTQAPRIIAGEEERQILSPGTRIYVQGLTRSDRLQWAIYRQGEALKDPETGDILGREAHYLGDAQLLRAGNPATLNISYANEEIAVNDQLLAIDHGLQQPYLPHAPATVVRGQIAKISAGLQETGAGRVVILNRGSAHGLEAGHVLAVQRIGQTITDPASNRKKSVTLKLPDEAVGLVMVFKTFPALSYALVMQASQPIRLEDRVVTPPASP